MNNNEFLDLYKKYGTSLYLFDVDALNNRINILKNKLPKNAQLCFAVKANPFFIEPLKDAGVFFEVCSPGEFSICKELNVNPKSIVFSGVCKTEKDIEEAYNYQVKTITLESLTQCKYLLNVVENSTEKHNQNVILRLTSGNQFGMSDDDLLIAIHEINKNETVNIQGIHFFTGTQKKFSKIQDELKFITSYCDELQQKTGYKISTIEYGPGLSYDYYSKEDYSSNYSDFDGVCEILNKSDYNFVIELGRYIASPCGKYLSEIKDIKNSNETKYCIIDGGINHINYFGQIMGMKNPHVHLLSEEKKDEHEQDYSIFGSLCTTADIIIRKIPLLPPKIGDVLCFEDVGAYTVTEGIYLFLSHPLPIILKQENGKIILLRNKIESYRINSRS